jgi:hypothetical protein
MEATWSGAGNVAGKVPRARLSGEALVAESWCGTTAGLCHAWLNGVKLQAACQNAKEGGLVA